MLGTHISIPLILQYEDLVAVEVLELVLVLMSSSDQMTIRSMIDLF